MRTVDRERTIGVESALHLIEALAPRLGITFEDEIVRTAASDNVTTTKSYVRHAESGKLLAEASGKGIGAQSRASALYEALEHAVFRYNLPGQSRSYEKAVLGDVDFGNLDYLYQYAQHATKLPQDTLRFFRLTSLGLDVDRSVLYPAIVAEIQYPLTASLGDLLPLSSYASNTGIASGANQHDAFLHAVNELIERDAESQFLLDINRGIESYSIVNLEPEDHLYNLFIELTGGYQGNGAIYSLQTVAGYAFCAQSEVDSGSAELGFGASMFPDIALERALTELQQVQYARSVNSTWEDEGGVKISNLNTYPNMQKIATRLFPRPDSARIPMRNLMEESSHRRGAEIIGDIEKAGFQVYGRVLWADKESPLSVVQALVPGFEGLNNLVFCRPIVATGRLRSRDVLDFLLSGGSDV